MGKPSLEPRTETCEIGGHVVTQGCVFHEELKKWEPIVMMKPGWDATSETSLQIGQDQFQDTPDAAMAVARHLVQVWANANGAGPAHSDEKSAECERTSAAMNSRGAYKKL